MPLSDYETSFLVETSPTESPWPKLIVRNRQTQAYAVYGPTRPTLGGPPRLEDAKAISVIEETGNELPAGVRVRAFQGARPFQQAYAPTTDDGDA